MNVTKVLFPGSSVSTIITELPREMKSDDFETTFTWFPIPVPIFLSCRFMLKISPGVMFDSTSEESTKFGLPLIVALTVLTDSESSSRVLMKMG